MGWDAIGAIGEIVGAFAVVATLGYLAVQIRQNTKVSRAQMSKDLFLASRSALLEIAGNSELATLMREIRGFEDLDATRRYAYLASFFRLFELQHNLSKQGLLDEPIARSYELILRAHTHLGYFDTWWGIAKPEYHEDFAAYVETQREMSL